jgi:hypothetical protein
VRYNPELKEEQRQMLYEVDESGTASARFILKHSEGPDPKIPTMTMQRQWRQRQS